MKTPIFATIVMCLFMLACGGPDTSVEGLEKSMQENPSPETALQLATAYMAYVDAHPDDKAKNSDYLLKASNVYYDLNNPQEAGTLLQRALANYPDEVAPSIKSSLNDLRMKMFNDSTGRIDFAKANQFIHSAETYADNMKADPEAPQLLHRAGETARSIRDFNKALSIYDKIYEQFPNFEKAPQALFLKAFTLDNDLKNTEAARELYQQFLEKHPDNEFADDTQFLLENLGKDDEEIIQSFQKKQDS